RCSVSPNRFVRNRSIASAFPHRLPPPVPMSAVMSAFNVRRSMTAVMSAVAAVAAVMLFTPTLSAQIPTPESAFGFNVGADLKLIDYDESIHYFQQLAAKSDRIKLVDVGKTSSGHAWTLAVISSPQNLARLDALTRIAQQLAHPTGLTDSTARQ